MADRANDEQYLLLLTPFERACYIQRCGIELVQKAQRIGVSMRIDRVPLQPLAMGYASHRVEAWPARHQPPAVTPRGGLDMPLQRREISDREWAAQPAGLREGCTTHVPGVGDL